MLVEKILKFILKLLHIILKITMGNPNNNRTKNNYSFKIFNYEKIEPSSATNKQTPLPRSGHRIVCDTKNLYSFGGYNPSTAENGSTQEEDQYAVQSFPLFQELWKFNFASHKWTRFSSRETLPQELASNAVIRQGNYLMVYSCVYGGTGSPFGYRCSNQLYTCRLTDENSKMCEIQTTGQLPLPQYGQALVYHNDYLYTIGGTTGFDYTCDIHRLNIKSQVWESVYICQGQGDYEPEGRYRHEVAFDGKYIYILGGGTAEEAFDFLDLPVFNIKKRTWLTQKTTGDQSQAFNLSIPCPRRCHGSVQIENGNNIQVFISGGYDGERVFDDLWKLDLTSYQWTLINTFNLPHPTYFHSTAVTPEGKMYIFGGIYLESEIVRNNKIHATWLCIPKLSEMCWEALLYYNPEIINCNKQKLMNMGMPRNFVQRLE